MSVEDIHLSPNFKFFLTFHYSLGFSIEYSDNKDEQLPKLESIADSLNDSLKDHTIFKTYTWSKREFDEEFPLLLQAKHGYLVGESTGPTEELQTIIENKNRSSKYSGVQLDSESMKETVVYFDHGVGSVNLVIEGRFDKLQDIKSFGDLALSIQRDIQYRQEKSLRVFEHWHDLRESMRQAFGSSLYDIWGIRLLGVEGRGQTRVVGTGALLYDDEKRYLIKERIDKLEVLLFDFAGLEKDKNEICEIEIDEKEKIYLAQGYDGHIAILSNDKQETWLTNLWQFITDHYAGVRDLERYLYAWAFSLSKEEQSPDLKDVRDALEAIPRIELSIDILTYESLPYNFAGKGYERKVYEGIYKAWDTEKAIESLNDKFNTLLEEKAQQKSNKIQYLLNILVFILACVTLISVSHDIFAFPYGNAFVKSWTPYILSLLFLFLGCIVFLYVMKESILSRKNKRK